jgi:hypothetical protein
MFYEPTRTISKIQSHAHHQTQGEQHGYQTKKQKNYKAKNQNRITRIKSQDITTNQSVVRSQLIRTRSR